MNVEDILYLEKNNRSTTVVSLYQTETIDETISTYLDQLCITHLSTLDGRVTAVKKKFGIGKFIPVYVSFNCVLQPIYPERNWQQIYVNVDQIKELEKMGNESMIIFKNNVELKLDISLTKLSKLIEKSLKIKSNSI